MGLNDVDVDVDVTTLWLASFGLVVVLFGLDAVALAGVVLVDKSRMSSSSSPYLNTPDKARYMASVVRLMKPGGRVVSSGGARVVSGTTLTLLSLLHKCCLLPGTDGSHLLASARLVFASSEACWCWGTMAAEPPNRTNDAPTSNSVSCSKISALVEIFGLTMIVAAAALCGWHLKVALLALGAVVCLHDRVMVSVNECGKHSRANRGQKYVVKFVVL